MSARQAVFTIAPDAPFLATLADRILDGTLLSGWPREGPFWLSDVTIVLPTRRARLALAEAFMRRGHGLLPDIRTFGGEAADEEPFLPPHDAPPQPRPVTTSERRLALARLIAAWAGTAQGREVLATPPNAAEIFALADSLAELIDDLAVERVSAEALRQLPMGELTENWQKSLSFLEVALSYWPAELAEQGAADAAGLRNERLRRQAEAAATLFGARPVIAAGSTGSIPATADLLQALAALPRGAIVLPGLDTGLTPDQHQRLLDPARAPHGHPQYGLARLLRHLGSTPAAVTELAPEPRAPRTHVVREALALAEETDGWAAARARLAPRLAAAAAGIGIVAARTPDETARAIALAAHDALARTRTVGIISPDQTLSRRIAAELARFGIVLDDPAGAPLFQSPAGRLARQVLAVAASDFGPVDLIALLRNRATTLGDSRAEIARLTDRLELRLLRGQFPGPGTAGLRRALADALETDDGRRPRLDAVGALELSGFIDRLEQALAPVLALMAREQIAAAQLAEALAAAMTGLCGGSAGMLSIPGAPEFTAWVEEVAGSPQPGPQFAPTGLDGILFALMQGHTGSGEERGRADIAIWGQLEARLQAPDMMILAGLNEDVWPQAADPGPWLSRGMRLALGLEPPERRQGLAAHDFMMALGNPEVLIAWSERTGTGPALPSRLVQRLEAFLGEDLTEQMQQRGRRWIEAGRRVDAVAAPPRHAQRPLPCPPAAMRPRRLSVTEVESLFRSPYDLYAKHVLRLRPLDPLGERPDARIRGTMIHKVFARFVEEGLSPAAPDALARLESFAEEAFAGLDAIGERRDIWLRRFAVAAKQFLAYERERQDDVVERRAELSGEWHLPEAPGFTLRGRADRVDLLRDGRLEIIDFKTGTIPPKGVMRHYEAPQLLLEAAMATAGALDGLPPTEVGALTYIKIGLGPEAFQPQPFQVDVELAEAVREVSQRLQGHVDALLFKDDLPMAAAVHPLPNRNYRGDYDHLARLEEWLLGP